MEDLKEFFDQIKKKITDNKSVSIAVLAFVIVLIGSIVYATGISDSKTKPTVSGNSVAASNMSTVAPDVANSTEMPVQASMMPTGTPSSSAMPIASMNPETTVPASTSTPATKSATTSGKATSKPAKKTSAPVSDDEIFTFKYYSSTASEICITGDLNNWQPISMKMDKNGYWFTKKVRLNKNIQYNFVENFEIRMDPFCKEYKTSSANSYVDVSVKKTSNYDGKIKPYTSLHFDYFTEGKDKTSKLETIYTSLKGRIIKYMSPATKKSKIRYYGVDYRSNVSNSMFNGTTPFAIYDTSEVYDQMDCCSSHELIHTMVSINNSFFNEGFAQCYQYEGNSNYKEQNVNINTAAKLDNTGTTGFMSAMSSHIKSTPTDYYCPASFIYYNSEILNNDAKLAKFLKSLSFSDSASSIKTKYRDATGKNMTTVVSNWETWLKGVNTRSNVYIKW